ncbi:MULTISPECIES: zinc-binding dehydrogenase [unclassified Bradyrhizobium]|uniref:zinc-binding dehydrogenase n=1 Tax=unclassified Bradyrhizobium TaxID=2631580 RepID=UPI001BAB3723|nr:MULTISPECIES: zinc-binding dehydrogenase [unclassified Bradyrhizobium]MBR1202962.1 zinc-binding dehydrogenase [Bradyrhizobium sp. AUGA SZCCT0124]MBR1314376.1 zinc-binding dehydrogenase [Bradyrhizobium sp. AUGA SZCCT0051]MBR1342606.1 zinc-binding dehydrogenase [Bradyrhizobium sp. AUGA SZCCT0105]MBR1352835.1 zinc-binding dehydrogenase [Bradyrhizobium sp. AUGA SZCCT0045]
MKAVVRRGKSLMQAEVGDVTPSSGQVLVKTLACGICGSDLHAVHHLDKIVEMGRRAGGASAIDLTCDLVMGHEFCAEILDHGPDTRKTLKAGTRVVSVPYAIGPKGMEVIGYSTRFPGGFAEQMVLTEAMLLEVPNGLSSEYAAMVEPMAVGAHAVAAADLSERPPALVLGCGPVGLAVIAALKRRGAGPVIAADYSAKRRAIAERLGADIIVDPATSSPHAHWTAFDVPGTLAELGAARTTRRDIRTALVFECVGAPGMLQAIIEQTPPQSQIVVVGVCMEEDKIFPALAISKQLHIRFVLGYTPDEFAATLRDIADGIVDVAPLYSGTVGLSGVAAAFEALASPEGSIKIIVDPQKA